MRDLQGKAYPAQLERSESEDGPGAHRVVRLHYPQQDFSRIRSKTSREKEYTGATTDLKRRMVEHNSSKSKHTSKYDSWS
jgi:hypothetical protein